MAEEAEVVDGGEIRVEDAEVLLGDGSGLLVLVEEGEDVGLELAVGHERGALAAADDAEHPLVEVPGLLHADAHLPWVRLRGPPGLPDGDVDVAVAEALHGGVDGVHLGVEHGGVVELGVGVVDAAVGAEEGVVQRLIVVAEVGVGVDHEGGARFAVELEHGREELGVVARAEAGVGWDAVGGGEDAEVVRGGDADSGEALEAEGLGEVAHGGEEGEDEVGVRGEEDLVAGEEEGDVGGGDVGGEVGADPGAGGVEAGLLVGEGREVGVGEGDGEGDGCVGEGGDEGRVGVEQLHAVDGGVRGEEGRHVLGRREVVGVGAVVDAHRHRRERRLGSPEGGGGDDEEGGEEHLHHWWVKVSHLISLRFSRLGVASPCVVLGYNRCELRFQTRRRSSSLLLTS